MCTSWLILLQASRSFSEILSLFTDNFLDQMTSASKVSRSYRQFDINLLCERSEPKILGNMQWFSSFFVELQWRAQRAYLFWQYGIVFGNNCCRNGQRSEPNFFLKCCLWLLNILLIKWQLRAERAENFG